MSSLFGKPAINNPIPQSLPPVDVPDPTQPDVMGVRERTMALAKGKRGRQSTILTGPGGLEPVSSTLKSLLGGGG